MSATAPPLYRRPQVMGILNVTPDSFSDGGRFTTVDAAVAHAATLVADGADCIDVGGESSRPGAPAVAAAIQIQRVVPVIAALRQRWPGLPLSIDTRCAAVAEAAIDAGATCINDISAGEADPDMLTVAARRDVVIVLMHMRGTPDTMQQAPHYDDVVGEIAGYLHDRRDRAIAAGVSPDRIVIDPGIGFGKTAQHNLALLRGLPRLTAIAAVLVGTSRKSFIGQVLDLDDPADRDTGTTVTHVIALLGGAAMLRVHDVRAAVHTVRILQALYAGAHGPAAADPACPPDDPPGGPTAASSMGP